MKARKKHKIIREGDPLFEKLKSQIRPDIAAKVKTITLIKAECEGGGLPQDECECKENVNQS